MRPYFQHHRDSSDLLIPPVISPGPRGQLQVVLPVCEALAGREAEPVVGGPVCIGVNQLPLVHWIAWFTGEGHPSVLLHPAGTFIPDWPQASAGIQVRPWAAGFRIDVEAAGSRWKVFRHLELLGALLCDLPNGSHLELMVAPTHAGLSEPGRHRFAGTVMDGIWQIERAYPAIDRESLLGMIALAMETDMQEVITARSIEEATLVREAGKNEPIAGFLSPVVEGNRLTLPEPERDLFPFLGASVFKLRYGSVWPVMNR